MIYSLKVASRYLTSNLAQTGLLIVGVAVGVYVFVFVSAPSAMRSSSRVPPPA